MLILIQEIIETGTELSFAATTTTQITSSIENSRIPSAGH